MGKLSIVFLLGLLVAVLAISSLFIRRESFEDAPSPADSGSGGASSSCGESPMLGPGVPNPSVEPPMLGPGVPNPGAPSSECGDIAADKSQRAALLRDIQQAVHNELASLKGMTTASSQPLFQTESSNKVLMSDDPSLQQGAEMKAARPTYCPKDMSQYIRKDQIPCWGCTLDY